MGSLYKVITLKYTTPYSLSLGGLQLSRSISPFKFLIVNVPGQPVSLFREPSASRGPFQRPINL